MIRSNPSDLTGHAALVDYVLKLQKIAEKLYKKSGNARKVAKDIKECFEEIAAAVTAATSGQGGGGGPPPARRSHPARFKTGPGGAARVDSGR
ncbi:MAG: hypothetical protein AAF514_24430 [Verrucomicrobiota bacterium]